MTSGGRGRVPIELPFHCRVSSGPLVSQTSAQSTRDGENISLQKLIYLGNKLSSTNKLALCPERKRK